MMVPFVVENRNDLIFFDSLCWIDTWVFDLIDILYKLTRTNRSDFSRVLIFIGDRRTNCRAP